MPGRPFKGCPPADHHQLGAESFCLHVGIKALGSCAGCYPSSLCGWTVPGRRKHGLSKPGRCQARATFCQGWLPGDLRSEWPEGSLPPLSTGIAGAPGATWSSLSLDESAGQTFLTHSSVARATETTPGLNVRRCTEGVPSPVSRWRLGACPCPGGLARAPSGPATCFCVRLRSQGGAVLSERTRTWPRCLARRSTQGTLGS